MKYLKYFEQNISYEDKKLTSLKELNIPKYFFTNFNCSNNQLTSLEFCPKEVGGYFDCVSNRLTSLEFCPKEVGGYFDCDNNNLASLEFCPEKIGGFFSCSNNQLTSLEFCPETINDNFYCNNNQLTSLEFCPKSVSGIRFNCSNNPWSNPLQYNLIKKFNITDAYTDEQINFFGSYEYQKEFLNNSPEKYKDLIPIGFSKEIKEEFDWLFNAADMGLL